MGIFAFSDIRREICTLNMNYNLRPVCIDGLEQLACLRPTGTKCKINNQKLVRGRLGAKTVSPGAN